MIALVLLLAAATPDGALEDRGFVESRSSSLRFGLSGGFGFGPRVSLDGVVWGAAELSGVMELHPKNVSFRVAATFRLGATDDRRTTISGSAGADFRFYPVERFGFGAGLELGVLGVTDEAVNVLLAPQLTLASVRLGEARQHEVSLSALLVITYPVWWPAAYGFARYTYYF